MSYDYTVLAGTQGMRNHLKKDRLFELAERRRLPVVLFAEGGGGRPGDVDWPIVAGPRLPRVPPVRAAQRARAAGRDRVRLLLRRQRGAARLLRRGHRHRGLEHRDGRAGDDRGRRARRRTRPRTSARSTCSTPTASSICGSRDDAEAVAAAKRYLSYFRGAAASHGHADADQRALRHLIPDQPQADLRRPRRHRRACSTRARARAAPRLRPRDGHRARARRRPSARRDRQRPDASRRRDRRRTAPTRRRASCSCATRSTCRSCSCATRRGSWSARRPSAPPPSATSRGCSSPAPTSSVPTGTVVLRKGYGLGAQAMAGRRLQGAAVHRRLADVGVRRRWDSRARCGSGCGASSRRSRTRDERERAFEATVAAAYERGKGINMAGLLRDRRRDRSGRHAGAGSPCCSMTHPGEWWTPTRTSAGPNIDAW